mgnify:CR=1 FL=1
MTADQVLKQELHIKLEQLSSAKLREALDFVSFLLSKQTNELTTQSSEADEWTPEHDPLSDFIGAVSHGALAQDIDKELYGT